MGSAKNSSAFPHGSAWERPGFLLWHATLRWKRIVEGVLATVDLTHVQFVLLASVRWLESNGESPSQRELAQHAGTDEMMTSQVVRNLERRELLTRIADAADSRVKRVRTTRQGARLATRAVRLVESVDVDVFGDGTDEQLVEALRRIAGRDAGGAPVGDSTDSRTSA